MTFVAKSRVRETSVSTGTGDFALAAAFADHRRFSDVMVVSDTCWYLINNPGNNQWEVGIGTYSAANTLTRTTVLESTNSNLAVNFTAGTKDVAMVTPGTIASHRLNEIEETLTAASTVNLVSVGTRRVAISGTTTITSFGTGNNLLKFLRFLSAGSPDVGVTITHNATSLICPAARNLVMFPGDTAIAHSDNSGNWRIVQVTRAYNAGGSGFPPTTAMLFSNATAPTGWTLSTTHNDKAIRIVNSTGGGSAGTLAFSTVFSRTASDNYTLLIADIPVHNHDTINISDPTHTHDIRGSSGAAGGLILPLMGTNRSNDLNSSASALAAGTSISATSTNKGGGGAHQHGMDIRVQYVDHIIATKD